MEFNEFFSEKEKEISDLKAQIRDIMKEIGIKAQEVYNKEGAAGFGKHDQDVEWMGVASIDLDIDGYGNAYYFFPDGYSEDRWAHEGWVPSSAMN